MGTVPEISILSADRQARQLALTRRMTIGRAEDSDIFFPDHLLSRRHAELVQQDDGFSLIDLDSTNGTFLNGERVVRETRLRDGDVITVGGNSIIFHEGVRQEANEAVARIARVHGSFDLTSRTTSTTIDVTDLSRDNRVLGLLTRASNALIGHRALPELFETVLDLVFEGLPAERAAILLLEGDPPTPAVKASRNRDGSQTVPVVSSSIAGRVVKGRVAMLLTDIFQDDLLSNQPSIIAAPIHSAMCAPLWFTTDNGAPTVLGLIYVDRRSGEPRLTDVDLQILTVLANTTATKIESARLYDENIEKRRLEDDMNLAAEIQASLLPDAAPRVTGYDISAATKSCLTVGGDYYDFHFDGTSLMLALGDVAGKGVGAAMLMVALRATVRSRWHDQPLGRATELMNQSFNQNVPHDRYATFFIGRLQVRDGKLMYVNAGHNRPLLIRAERDFDTLDDGGTVLGAFADSRYRSSTATLEPGDILVMFSDGVSDTWQDAALADRKLVDIVRATRHLEAASILTAIFEEIERVSGPKPSDDRTLVVVKRLPE